MKMQRLRRAMWAFGLLALVAGMPGVCLARGPISTPEIDPGSMASAVTLLCGGVLMLTGRRSRK